MKNRCILPTRIFVTEISSHNTRFYRDTQPFHQFLDDTEPQTNHFDDLRLWKILESSPFEFLVVVWKSIVGYRAVEYLFVTFVTQVSLYLRETEPQI